MVSIAACVSKAEISKLNVIELLKGSMTRLAYLLPSLRTQNECNDVTECLQSVITSVSAAMRSLLKSGKYLADSCNLIVDCAHLILLCALTFVRMEYDNEHLSAVVGATCWAFEVRFISNWCL